MSDDTPRFRVTFSAQVNKRRIDLTYFARGLTRREAINVARRAAERDNPGIHLTFRGCADA